MVKDATCMETLNQLAGFVSRHPSGLSVSTALDQEVVLARDTTRMICLA